MHTKNRHLLALVTVAAIFAGGCTSSGSGSSTRPPRSTVAATTSSSTSAGAADQPTKADGPYGVGRSDVTYVDPSRTTPADTKNDVAASAERTLPVMILYPTATTSDEGKANGHPMADGRFPLFVFSHGVTASGPLYATFLINIARAGYIVAAPTYPLTSGGHGWDNLTQYKNQPGDVSFIITQILGKSKDSTGLLAGHVAPKAIATGGHSLGAMTTLGFYNSCCKDVRIDAAVEISGVMAPFGKGSFASPPTTPLLLIHGKADKTVPYNGSKEVFDTFTKTPRAFLTYPEGSHVGVVFEKPDIDDSQAAIIAFLNLELRHDDTAWRSLGKKLADDGVGSIEVAGGLPAPS